MPPRKTNTGRGGAQLFSSHLLKMEEVVAKVQKIAEEVLAHPLALPVAVGIATVLFTVVLFFSLTKKGGKSKKKRTPRATLPAGGTTTVDGVRRSTR